MINFPFEVMQGGETLKWKAIDKVIEFFLLWAAVFSNLGINPSSLCGMYFKTIGLYRKHSPWGWNFTEYHSSDDKHYFTVYGKSNVVLNLFTAHWKLVDVQTKKSEILFYATDHVGWLLLNKICFYSIYNKRERLIIWKRVLVTQNRSRLRSV